MKPMRYVGPNSNLHGRTALVFVSRNLAYAQFDFEEDVPLEEQSEWCFGWNEIPLEAFEDI